MYFPSEAEDSNETPSSEEEQELLEYSQDHPFKQSSARRSITQVIKDKKKQTQLTLQWYTIIPPTSITHPRTPAHTGVRGTTRSWERMRLNQGFDEDG